MNSAKRRNTALALALAFGLVGGLALPAASAHAADSDAPRAGGRRAFLGVRIQELTNDLRDSYDYRGAGVVVAGVTDGSPADKLGIEDGDIITKFDDMPVNDPDQLARRVGSRSPGSLVSVSVWRDGKEISLGRVALSSPEDRSEERSEERSGDRSGNRSDERSDDNGDRRVIIRRAPRAPRAPEAPDAPDAPAPPAAPRYMHGHGGDNDNDNDNDHDMGTVPGLEGLRGLQGLQGLQGLEGMGHGNGSMVMAFGRGRLGVELSDLDSDLGSYFKGAGGRGVLVTRVLEGTPADQAGLKAGDVITEFGGNAVSGSDDLRRLVQQQGAGEVDLRVRRHGDEHTFTARLGQRNNMMGMRSLPGGGGGSGDVKTKVEKHMYRFRGPGGDAWGDDQKLSPEDRAQLRKDMEQLRNDMRQMHMEMHKNLRKGDDDSRDDGKDDDKDNGKDDDDDSGN